MCLTLKLIHEYLQSAKEAEPYLSKGSPMAISAELRFQNLNQSKPNSNCR